MVILLVTKMYPINVILAAELARFILLDIKYIFTALQLLEIRSMPILWPMFCMVIPKSNLQRITAAHEGSLNRVSMECECTRAFDALLSLPKGPINLASSVRESTIAKVKWQWEKGKGNRSYRIWEIMMTFKKSFQYNCISSLHITPLTPRHAQKKPQPPNL